MLQTQATNNNNSPARVSKKLKISLDLVLKTKPYNNLTSVQRFSDRNCEQSESEIKSNKNDFTCIQHADKERFKTRPKQSLACRFFLLTTVSK